MVSVFVAFDEKRTAGNGCKYNQKSVNFLEKTIYKHNPL